MDVDKKSYIIIYWQLKQVLKKEIDTQLSTTENGGLNLKTTTTDEDVLGLGNVKKVSGFLTLV